MKISFTLSFLLIAVFIPHSSSHPQPLDPLTPFEISVVCSVVTSSHLNLSTALTFHYVVLDESDKSSVLSWTSSSSSAILPPHRVFVIVCYDRQTHELVVDISGGYIASHRVPNDPAYSMLTLEEEVAAGLLAMNFTPFVESVRKMLE